MYTKINSKNLITIIDESGIEKWHFNNYKEFLYFISTKKVNYLRTLLKDAIGDKIQTTTAIWPTQNKTCLYIVLDQKGKQFTKKEIDNSLKDLNIKETIFNPLNFFYVRLHWSLNCYYKCEFRKTPVPYVGYGNKASRSFYKKIRTTQERRSLENIKFTIKETGFNIKIRGKRSKRNLPTAWDDKPKSIYGNNNWKRYRKTQYKARR